MASKRRAFGKIRKLPSGRYQASYVGPDGVRHTAPDTYGATTDAEGWLSVVRRSIRDGTWNATHHGGGQTLSDYARRWLAGRDLRDRTRTHYDRLLTRLILPELGGAKLHNITPAMVRDWHARLGTTTPTQTAHAYALLHAILATAVLDEVIPSNPARIVRATQTKRKHEVVLLEPAEVAELAAAMPEELAASVWVAAWCGLRYGEVFALRRKDVSARARAISVTRSVSYVDGKAKFGPPKTAAGIRVVAVPPHVQAVLTAHLADHVKPEDQALLFARDDGGPWCHHHLQYPWEAAREAIGKPALRFQDLRHVAAVRAAQAGATTAELMARIGHSSPAAALRYQHAVAGRDADVAARISAMFAVGGHEQEAAQRDD